MQGNVHSPKGGLTMGYFSQEAIELECDDGIIFDRKQHNSLRGYSIPDDKVKGEDENER